MEKHNEIPELHKSMIAAIRNPDNSNNLVAVPVTVGGVETTAICWVGSEESEVNPMAIIVTPELFASITPK